MSVHFICLQVLASLPSHPSPPPSSLYTSTKHGQQSHSPTLTSTNIHITLSSRLTPSWTLHPTLLPITLTRLPTVTFTNHTLTTGATPTTRKEGKGRKEQASQTKGIIQTQGTQLKSPAKSSGNKLLVLSPQVAPYCAGEKYCVYSALCNSNCRTVTHVTGKVWIPSLQSCD